MIEKNDFILNVDISTSKRFSQEYLESFKSQMEKEFGFNEFLLILLENSEISPSGRIEIYVEDLEMEFDLTEDIESIIPYLDQNLQTLEVGSKIEWYSPMGFSSFVWEKLEDGWNKSEENDDFDFYDDDSFSDPYYD